MAREHESITLLPINPAFDPLAFTENPAGRLKVIAEFLDSVTERT